MALATCPLVAFDEDGENVAYYGPESSLKIWETTTGTLKQEYVPSSHLSAVCTCLSWMPTKTTESQKKKRKKRKSEADTVFEKIIALGTLKGNILLYNFSLGDLQRELSDGHVDAVNDVQWNMNSKELFSCSHDGHVIQWHLRKGRPKSKWRADKGSVSCIALSADGETLFTAGKTILWWDIESQQILKKFTGHATQIIQLKLITFPEETLEDGYILSAAAGDRSLSVWPLKSKSRSALVNFNVAEDPLILEVYSPSSRTEKIVIASVTRTGILHIFEQQLNGKKGPPLEPQSTLQIVDDSPNPRPIKIFSGFLNRGASRNITIAYDNKLKLTCEKIDLNSLKRDECLVRSSGLPKVDSSHSKLKVRLPDEGKAKTMNLSAFNPQLPTQEAESNDRKRKSTKGDSTIELPMDKRLNALRLRVLPGEDSRISSENVAHLLIQGLHSNDETILDQVFIGRKKDAIEKTIRRLPIDVILPLIEEIKNRICNKWSSTTLLTWIHFILVIHSSYLTTCSTELCGYLNPIYQITNRKENLFNKICSVKGKMDLLVSTINSKDESLLVSKPALFSFEDESSAEESDVNELLYDHGEDVDDIELDEAEEGSKEDDEGRSSDEDGDSSN